ncbi:hypothetical protein M407DRAFT_4559 [Tulasnella calospora MUT 4182]|uniref:Uncharacterized protein n=1 Tax=Tulasnella calospora MUT 4182 TaxID=1051891 RepID=A0A0C3QV11_9AGAM|nr:hypothetical protein M407DRAFT_4559 [Tulasnella calospora MUT 4182]
MVFGVPPRILKSTAYQWCYAKRVRSLNFGDFDEYYRDGALCELGLDVIGIISLHHPYGASFLPHIKSLGWWTSYSTLQMIPFLSGALLYLNLHLGNEDEAQITKIFNTLRNRTLKLKTFHLKTRAVGPALEKALALWLKNMETLEKIESPPYYLTASILATIKTLPRLQIINQTAGSRNVHNNVGMLGTLPENSFPSLVQLTLPATPASAQRFLFDTPTNFTGLTLLELHAPKDIEANQLLGFTKHLAIHCPMITSIELVLFLSSAFRSQGATALSIGILESVYPCKLLTRLKIAYPLPREFNSADVENMGKAWPRMTNLSLCPEPDFSFPILEHMGAKLSILPAFALHLPNLQTLE